MRFLWVGAAAIAGVCSGALVAHWTAEERPPANSEPSPARADELGVESGVVRGDEPAALSVAPTPRAAEPTAGAPPPLPDVHALVESARLEAREAPPPPNAAGDIAVRVLDESGAPFPGISVRLVPEREARAEHRSNYRSNPSLEDRLRTEIADSLWREARARSAVTDGSGTCLFGDLAADCRYYCAPEGDSWAFAPRFERLRPGERITLIATWEIPVEFDVRLPDGSLPDEAMIEANTGRYWTGGTWKPEARTVRLKRGCYKISAAVGETLRSGSVDLRIETGVAVPAIRLDLAQRPGIHGTIRVPLGDPTTRFRAFVKRLVPGERPSAELLHAAREVSVDHRQRFAIPDLAPGRYLVGIARGGSLDVEATAVATVAGEPVEMVIELAAPTAGEVIVARIFQGGAPLVPPNVDFMLLYPTADDHNRSDMLEAVRRVEHEYWLALTAQGRERLEAAQGEIAVGARVSGVGYQERKIPRTIPCEVSFDFAPSASALLEVAAPASGRTPGSGTFQLQRAADDLLYEHYRWAFGSEAIAVPGRAQIAFVESGSYLLHWFRRPDPSDSDRFWIGSEPLDLAPGENRLQMAVPGLFRLAVAIEIAGIEAKHCWLSSEEQSYPLSSTLRPDRFENGVAEFLVGSGRYVLHVHAPAGSRKESIEVSGDTNIRFRPEYPDALAVSEVDVAGWLFATGLENGDLVIAADGKPLVGDHQCAMAASRIGNAGALKLTVLRAGEEIELLRPAELPDPPVQRGGNLVPVKRGSR